VSGNLHEELSMLFCWHQWGIFCRSKTMQIQI